MFTEKRFRSCERKFNERKLMSFHEVKHGITVHGSIQNSLKVRAKQ